MIMAMEAAHLFSTAFPGFTPVYDSHLQTIAAATLSWKDAVLFFSYSGSTKELLDLLEVVREQGGQGSSWSRISPNLPPPPFPT